MLSKDLLAIRQTKISCSPQFPDFQALIMEPRPSITDSTRTTPSSSLPSWPLMTPDAPCSAWPDKSCWSVSMAIVFFSFRHAIAVLRRMCDIKIHTMPDIMVGKMHSSQPSAERTMKMMKVVNQRMTAIFKYNIAMIELEEELNTNKGVICSRATVPMTHASAPGWGFGAHTTAAK